ncbi:hypothetical protein ZTR_05343 [Talaromyces verruculosus]|nr:hypothetical protein ZTR_05343 [Talaromyces verruculosus]
MEMNHLIGQRFNLISKSDIRYVGTLHEINPEASTIALENVVSHGTEGRRGNPSEEIPASTTIYEYIVFRGSDVKDISVAEEKKEPEVPPSQVPDDPAILGSMPRPGPQAPQQQPPPPGPPGPTGPSGGRPGPPPGYPQQPPFQGYGYPPYGQQRFGPPGYGPPGPGFPPYGAPPGWFPPPGQGFPPGPPGQFPGHQGPIGPPGQQRPGPGAPINPPKNTSELPVGEKTTAQPTSKTATPAPGAAPEGPTPPVESKPTIAEVARGPAPVAPQGPAATAPAPQTPSKLPPNGPKNDRFIPAIPIANPAVKPAVPLSTAQQGAVAASQSTAQAAITEATRAATAAVAAAMAKLPQPGAKKPNEAGVDDMMKRFNELKPYDNNRTTRGGHHGPRGGRTHGPRGGPHVAGKKLELPDTDFDFESANAKFNKQDLVKEAIATGSPIVEEEKETHKPEEVPSSPSAAPSAYNKSSSFFDNISSEIRDREENTARPRERRGEEEKKNIETFGQGSVDGYRGYRGRGRGRGYGRGGYNRGYGNRGRGNYRGRGASQSTGVPTQT